MLVSKMILARFFAIVDRQLHSRYVMESEILEARSRTFYLRLRNPGNSWL